MPRKGRVLPVEVERHEPPRTRKELRVELSGRSNGDVHIRILDFNGRELSPGDILFSRYDIVGNSNMTLMIPVEWT